MRLRSCSRRVDSYGGHGGAQRAPRWTPKEHVARGTRSAPPLHLDAPSSTCTGEAGRESKRHHRAGPASANKTIVREMSANGFNCYKLLRSRPHTDPQDTGSAQDQRGIKQTPMEMFRHGPAQHRTVSQPSYGQTPATESDTRKYFDIFTCPCAKLFAGTPGRAFGTNFRN